MDFIIHHANDPSIGSFMFFNLGMPHDYKYQYPSIFIQGGKNFGTREYPGQMYVLWDRPYDPVPTVEVISPALTMGESYHLYLRATPNWIYFELDGWEIINKTTTIPGYNVSCCLQDIYQIYLGADGYRPSANATIWNVGVYSVNPFVTLDPSSSPTTDPTRHPTSYI